MYVRDVNAEGVRTEKELLVVGQSRSDPRGGAHIKYLASPFPRSPCFHPVILPEQPLHILHLAKDPAHRVALTLVELQVAYLELPLIPQNLQDLVPHIIPQGHGGALPRVGYNTIA